MFPFRESKLTRFFQGFFCGKGQVSMMVNANMCTSTFEKTMHVMKVTAVRKQAEEAAVEEEAAMAEVGTYQQFEKT